MTGGVLGAAGDLAAEAPAAAGAAGVAGATGGGVAWAAGAAGSGDAVSAASRSRGQPLVKPARASAKARAVASRGANIRVDKRKYGYVTMYSLNEMCGPAGGSPGGPVRRLLNYHCREKFLSTG